MSNTHYIVSYVFGVQGRLFLTEYPGTGDTRRGKAKRFSSLTEIANHLVLRRVMDDPLEDVRIIRVEESAPVEVRRVLAEGEAPQLGEAVQYGFASCGLVFTNLSATNPEFIQPLRDARLFGSRVDLLDELQRTATNTGRRSLATQTLAVGSDIVRVAVSTQPGTVTETELK